MKVSIVLVFISGGLAIDDIFRAEGTVTESPTTMQEEAPRSSFSSSRYREASSKNICYCNVKHFKPEFCNQELYDELPTIVKIGHLSTLFHLAAERTEGCACHELAVECRDKLDLPELAVKSYFSRLFWSILFYNFRPENCMLILMNIARSKDEMVVLNEYLRGYLTYNIQENKIKGSLLEKISLILEYPEWFDYPFICIQHLIAGEQQYPVPTEVSAYHFALSIPRTLYTISIPLSAKNSRASSSSRNTSAPLLPNESATKSQPSNSYATKSQPSNSYATKSQPSSSYATVALGYDHRLVLKMITICREKHGGHPFLYHVYCDLIISVISFQAILSAANAPPLAAADALGNRAALYLSSESLVSISDSINSPLSPKDVPSRQLCSISKPDLLAFFSLLMECYRSGIKHEISEYFFWLCDDFGCKIKDEFLKSVILYFSSDGRKEMAKYGFRVLRTLITSVKGHICSPEHTISSMRSEISLIHEMIFIFDTYKIFEKMKLDSLEALASLIDDNRCFQGRVSILTIRIVILASLISFSEMKVKRIHWLSRGIRGANCNNLICHSDVLEHACLSKKKGKASSERHIAEGNQVHEYLVAELDSASRTRNFLKMIDVITIMKNIPFIEQIRVYKEYLRQLGYALDYCISYKLLFITQGVINAFNYSFFIEDGLDAELVVREMYHSLVRIIYDCKDAYNTYWYMFLDLHARIYDPDCSAIECSDRRENLLPVNLVLTVMRHPKRYFINYHKDVWKTIYSYGKCLLLSSKNRKIFTPLESPRHYVKIVRSLIVKFDSDYQDGTGAAAYSEAGILHLKKCLEIIDICALEERLSEMKNKPFDAWEVLVNTILSVRPAFIAAIDKSTLKSESGKAMVYAILFNCFANGISEIKCRIGVCKCKNKIKSDSDSDKAAEAAYDAEKEKSGDDTEEIEGENDLSIEKTIDSILEALEKINYQIQKRFAKAFILSKLKALRIEIPAVQMVKKPWFSKLLLLLERLDPIDLIRTI